MQKNNREHANKIKHVRIKSLDDTIYRSKSAKGACMKHHYSCFHTVILFTHLSSQREKKDNSACSGLQLNQPIFGYQNYKVSSFAVYINIVTTNY